MYNHNCKSCKRHSSLYCSSGRVDVYTHDTDKNGHIQVVGRYGHAADEYISFTLNREMCNRLIESNVTDEISLHLVTAALNILNNERRLLSK